jgi:UDP-N-acetylmuramate: L-alanyl-gamma-D-glutamyl-meso-diaminopimelate ligase
MRVHFIAIGGSAMHNLAIALHLKGYRVTGSDDEIFEPSRSRLSAHGLLPATEGWEPSRITSDLDAVILGMHARYDNPELAEARRLQLKIFSYPEYLYEQSKDKKRVVIGGSHGKTTITAMILHVAGKAGIDCDYMVGAQLEGFDVMVKLTNEAPVMVIEGDEYLTSPIDPRPKFHLYHPDIAILSGIAWDHINVFPTYENYVNQFLTFISLITSGGSLIYSLDDSELRRICSGLRADLKVIPYEMIPHQIRDGVTSLITASGLVPLQIFGRHNMMNISAARFACNQLGIPDEIFIKAISSFKGASKRLELVEKNDNCVIYRDFAHAPSKVLATLEAVREQFSGRKVVACLELHTFSSLSRDFLQHYAHSLDAADVPVVYFNPHALKLKRLPDISPEQIREGFANKDLEVFSDSNLLFERLKKEDTFYSVFLMMSSGNYDGKDLKQFAAALLPANHSLK